MGYILHHTIVVTSWDNKRISLAANKARRLKLLVIGPSREAINGYTTMTVCPDGSKEGWEESASGDAKRSEFIAWLISKRYDDESSPYCWVEISYSSDDREAKITRSEWRKT